jgi:hypothetical protein
MLLDNIINNIITEINNIPRENPVFIYTGVGASGAIDDNGVLLLENYHQYPPFLQNLKNTIHNLHIFIILIDPYQESPPYIVNDKNVLIIKKLIEVENEPDINYYTNTDNTLTVYTMHKCVYAHPYEAKNENINITKQLRKLNLFAIENNITTLYHDFTGRKNSLLAEYFDSELYEHLDHIIYSLSAREDHGCRFDLTDISSYFPFRIDFHPFINDNKRVIIRLFNIFRFTEMDTIREKLEIETMNYPPYMRSMIEKQKEQVIKSIKDEMRNENFSNLRIMLRLIKGEEKYEEIKYIYFFNHLPEYEKNKALSLYHGKEFNNLFYFLINYYGKKIDLIVKIKQLDISGSEILQFIINGSNPHDWYKSLETFFNF